MNTTLYYEYKINLFLSDHPFIITLLLIVITFIVVLGLVCSSVYCVRNNTVYEEDEDEKNVTEIELVERSHYIQLIDPK